MLNQVLVIFLLFSSNGYTDELARSGSTTSVAKKNTAEVVSQYSDYDPFFEACKKIDSNKKIIPVKAVSPITLGIPKIVQSDKNGHTAYDLINEAYKYTQSVLRQNLENTKKSLACVDEVFNKKISDIKNECKSTFQEMANSAIANQRARYELAIALPNGKVLNDTQYRTLNTDLNIPLNTFKAEKWQPINEREKKILTETWDQFLLDVDKESKEKMPNSNSGFSSGPTPNQQYKLMLVQQKRKSAMLNYHMQMTQYPLIQFLPSDDPNKSDFKKAYELIIKNIENEMENIKTKQNKLVLDNPKKEITSEDLFVLNYQTTENLLASNPEYCSIAQSQMEFQKKKQMYFTGGTMAVMLGASFVKVPSAAIFTVGSALSGLSSYEAYVKYKEAMQAHLASPTYEDQVFRKVKVDQDKQAFVLNTSLSIALGLPNPIRFGQVLNQSETISKAQFAKFFEPEVAAASTSAERIALMQKINKIEKEVFPTSPIDQQMMKALKDSGRGIGEKILYVNESGSMYNGQILRHFMREKMLMTQIAKEIQYVDTDGKLKKKIIQLEILASDTVPASIP